MPMNDEHEIQNQMYWYENADVQSLLKIPMLACFLVAWDIFLHHCHQVFQLLLL